MRYLKWIVLITLLAVIAGNIALFALAFRGLPVPDSLAAGFSIGVPVELIMSALIRVFEGRERSKDDEEVDG